MKKRWLLSIVAVVALTACSASQNNQVKLQTINVDFGIGDPSPETKPADYWNAASGGNRLEPTKVTGLKTSRGQLSPVELELINLGGGWGNKGIGVDNKMLASFNYPYNNRGGNSEVIIRQVPAGTYDLYIYGRGANPAYYGDYTVTVGKNEYGRKQTGQTWEAVNSKQWKEGSQYVLFSNINVQDEDSIRILIQPNDANPSDAMISGLQLVPSLKNLD